MALLLVEYATCLILGVSMTTGPQICIIKKSWIKFMKVDMVHGIYFFNLCWGWFGGGMLVKEMMHLWSIVGLIFCC